MTPYQAAALFVPSSVILSLEPLGNGNVNQTWRLTLEDGSRRVLQRLRPEIFPDPVQVVRNTCRLLAHLNGLDEQPYQCIRLFPARNGQDWATDSAGGCWRMLSHVERSRTLEHIETSDQARVLGRAVGWFHRALASLDLKALQTPLPGLHQTSAYLSAYDQLNGEEQEDWREQFCRQYIAAQRTRAMLLEEAAINGLLRRQHIHGDPKVANCLFAGEEDRVLCLIDLDTAGPGLLLHDIGDSLRSCCNPGGEDAEDPAALHFSWQFYRAWLEGYLAEAGSLLGPEDRELILTAAWTITFELGLRFFLDHLQGNCYFAVRDPEHNLRRAVIQFHLCLDMAEGPIQAE